MESRSGGNSAVLEEMILRRHSSMDDHLKDIYGFLMSVHVRAAGCKDPECIGIEAYFERITPHLLETAERYEALAQSGDADSVIGAAEAFCALGDAYRHSLEKFSLAFDCYARGIRYLNDKAEILSKYPEAYPLLSRIAYGAAFLLAFGKNEPKAALDMIDDGLQGAGFRDTFEVSYRKLSLLKAVISDEPKAAEEIVSQLNEIGRIMGSIEEHCFLDLLIIGKAYQKVALYCMRGFRGIKSARRYITEGYRILPDGLIKEIYAKDLWRLCPAHNEAALLDGTGSGYKNEVFDANHSGGVYANYYLAILYFTLGTGDIAPDPKYYRTAYHCASAVLKNSAEKIREYKKVAADLDGILKQEKETRFRDPAADQTETLKSERAKLAKALAAYDFMQTVIDQSALHRFVMTECLKCGSSDYFDIPLEDIGETSLKYRILKGAALFREGSKTKDKNAFQKAYGYLSELLTMRFDRNDMENLQKYEQILMAEGYIALAELIGNKKCGIGSDTEKAKAILDALDGSFTFLEAGEYFGRYYAKIKKSLFGGYSFRWIVK